MYRSFRIVTIIVFFFFLTGFVPIMSFVGPGMTVITTGNVYKAATQLIIDQSIKKKTGKNSLVFVSEKINKNNQNYKKNKFNEDLRKLIEQRIKITRKKLDDQNLKKLVKKRINLTRSILNLTNTTQ
tara:strand:+ start:216 stop:596 length:381 start_codon:yes stop_codon:yes gene_type:complete